MSMCSRIHRVVLLLAFLPQLVVMGMGQSVVVCVGDDGHMQLEVIVGGCCADTGEAPMGSAPALSTSENDSDCVACSDIGVVLDPRPARGASVESLGLGHFVVQLSPFAVEPVDGSATPEATVASEAAVGGAQPQHLHHRRSVQLIC